MSNELQLLVEKISLEVFRKPFQHTARFNNRLRTTGGRYMLQDHSIEINPSVHKKYGLDELVGVIKHELCHYHLHLEGKGYKHGDTDFKNLLKQTGSPRHCQPLATREKRARTTYIYKCNSCGLTYRRKRKMDVLKYKCGKCFQTISEVSRIQS